MLWALFLILLVVWLLAMSASYTLGGYIHLLLVLAFITAVTKLVQHRRDRVVTVETKI
jgi:Family of unknown function (DUF5670)